MRTRMASCSPTALLKRSASARVAGSIFAEEVAVSRDREPRVTRLWARSLSRSVDDTRPSRAYLDTSRIEGAWGCLAAPAPLRLSGRRVLDELQQRRGQLDVGVMFGWWSWAVVGDGERARAG